MIFTNRPKILVIDTDEIAPRYQSKYMGITVPLKTIDSESTIKVALLHLDMEVPFWYRKGGVGL